MPMQNHKKRSFLFPRAFIILCFVSAVCLQGCDMKHPSGGKPFDMRETPNQQHGNAPSAEKYKPFEQEAANQQSDASANGNAPAMTETEIPQPDAPANGKSSAMQDSAHQQDTEGLDGAANENSAADEGGVVTGGFKRLEPGSIQYLGAFRLPGDEEWEWSGEALCFHDNGNDGKGSLFGTGHNHRLRVSEMSIPEPVISDNIQSLPVAATIQPFMDMFCGLYDNWYTEIPRIGLEILDGRIYFCRGEHFQNDGNPASHGYASLNLAQPDAKGLWMVGDNNDNYATNDYLFKIPQEWSRLYASGYTLATGRYRDGGWGGMGPSLFMIKPEDMKSGSTAIPATELIRYTDVDNWSGEPRYKINEYCEADTWTGGAWVCADAGSAVIFCGNHGFGENTWYGFADGTVYPIDGSGPFPEVPPYPYDQRGWWNDDIRPALMLYDPNDLAKSALGEMEPYEMQPYAILDISEHTCVPLKDTMMQYLGDLAYDDGRQRIYVQELFADGTKPVIHVFGFE